MGNAPSKLQIDKPSSENVNAAEIRQLFIWRIQMKTNNAKIIQTATGVA